MRSKNRTDSSPDRSGSGAGTVYGLRPVLELLRARPEELEELLVAAEGNPRSPASAELFARARDAGIKVQKVSRERLAGLADGGVHQGVVARVRAFEYAELEDLVAQSLRAQGSSQAPLIVVLDGVQDPQNLGAILRSTHALGGHGVVIGKDRSAQVTASAIKASAGAAAHCPVARVVNISRALEQLKEAGFWIAAAHLEDENARPPWAVDLTGPVALVMGGEGAGVRDGVLKHCDFKLKIPMETEIASLNVSVTSGLLLYEVCRQRSKA